MNPDYLISIVTPFHNTDLKLFQRCVRSMREQILGFENIEWIVVVHNSDQAYLEGVRQLLGDDPNVRIEELHNDCGSPSSPRNHGLSLATADYVGFLDSDDEFTPECLEEALAHMKNSGAQITWFRREYELEDENSIPITEIVLWDQTRTEILVTRDENWDDEKMFSGICGMVTSRLYDRRFLMDQGILFDESVPFAEDYLFNLEAYGHAEKICYLPQLIGYHYYINNKSLVQGKEKSAETLISYAEGYKKVFDTGLRYGFYMNAIIGGLCCVLARFLVSSTTLKLEDRIRIRDILSPYLDIMEPIRVSKLYSEKDVKNRYDFPREVILNPEKYAGPGNREELIDTGIRRPHFYSKYQYILKKIVDVNGMTDMGKRYGLVDIMSVEGFQTRVPVTKYETYEPIVKLQTRIGESGILTSDPVIGYVIRSNPFGSPRMFPVTERHLKPYVDAFTRVAEGKVSFLLFECLPPVKKYNDNTYLNSISGMTLSAYLTKYLHRTGKDPDFFTSPGALLKTGEVADFTYVRLLYALRRRDVEQILSPLTWGIVDAFWILEKNWKKVVEDIRNGTIGYDAHISESLRSAFEEDMNPDPERANELEAIFKRGFEEPVAKLIWPKLSVVVAGGMGTYRIYTDRMKRYTGDVPHRNYTLSTSEAIIGMETEKSDLYSLAMQNAFIEFVPVEGEDKNAVSAPRTEIGKEYTLLLTTYAGLYRYEYQQAVKVQEFRDEVPLFSLEYALFERVPMGGGFVTNTEIYDALKETASAFSIRLMDYAFHFREEEKLLEILVETENDSLEERPEREKVAAAMDLALKKRSGAYRNARETDHQPPLSVLYLESETQFLFRDIYKAKTQCAPDQLAPVRNLQTEELKTFFFGRVLRGS